MVVDVRVRNEDGEVWQGKMGDRKVFGEGFEEVTVDSVKGVMKGWKWDVALL